MSQFDSQPIAQKCESPLDGRLAVIQVRIETLTECLDRLECRLRRVMTPTLEAIGGQNLKNPRANPTTPNAPLVDELDQVIGRLEGKIETVRRLTDSLAL